jgi:phosphatidylserine/phosphatidylglycerophosphate/cardiolipin synthase-like enzyme
MKKPFLSILIIGSFLVGCYSQQLSKHTTSDQQVKAEQSSNDIEWAFTREQQQHPDQLLIHVIDSSRANLDIAIYSLTNYDIVDAIANAKKRGVNVRIITDREGAGNKTQSKELAYLSRAGIPIKENSHSGLMHMKVTIADQSTVTTGSFNYTQAASTINDENLVVIHDAKMAQSFEDEFNLMWNDRKNFEDWK